MEKLIVDYFKEIFARNPDLYKMLENLKSNSEITSKNVLQSGDPKLRKLMESVVDNFMLETSEFRHKANIDSFLDAIKSGKKGLILAEHYSNLDYPILLNLMRESGPSGAEIEKRCIAIAGLKLNEDNPYIAACASGYDRIYIYPSRSLRSIQDKNELEKQIKKSKEVNLASVKALEKVKKEGRVVVVYPAGTRYRPGKPETKKGVKEIDSYIKMFDVMLLVSVNGNCLRISDTGNMQEDIVCKDRIILDASPVINCSEFRKEVHSKNPDLEGVAKKQIVADKVMEILEEMHIKNEVGRI